MVDIIIFFLLISFIQETQLGFCALYAHSVWNPKSFSQIQYDWSFIHGPRSTTSEYLNLSCIWTILTLASFHGELPFHPFILFPVFNHHSYSTIISPPFQVQFLLQGLISLLLKDGSFNDKFFIQVSFISHEEQSFSCIIHSNEVTLLHWS